MTRTPTALIVYESMFDNTATVAEAVARGLRGSGMAAHAVPVTSLAATGPVRVDLLVVGAPTHAFGLSRAATRADAVRQGAAPGRAAIGIREWIPGAAPHRFGTERLAVFDTRAARVRRSPLAAGRTAVRLLRRRGFHLLLAPAAFLVENVPGPLCEGEEERAEEWGRTVGAACREQLSLHLGAGPEHRDLWHPDL